MYELKFKVQYYYATVSRYVCLKSAELGLQVFCIICSICLIEYGGNVEACQLPCSAEHVFQSVSRIGLRRSKGALCVDMISVNFQMILILS